MSFTPEQNAVWTKSFRRLRYEAGVTDFVLTQFDFPDAWFKDIKVPPFSWMRPFWPDTQLPGSNIEEDTLNIMVWYWVSVISNLRSLQKNQGGIPEDITYWIEIANEPDGYWNTYIAPEIYRIVIEKLRYELDILGHNNVKIIGPGLAYLAHPEVNFSWIREMTSNTVKSLSAWSSHAWDEALEEQDGYSGFSMESIMRKFMGAVRTAEHRSLSARKPVIITEFASANTRYEGQSFPSLNKKQPDPISNTSLYGVRVVANFLNLIQSGASAALYWELFDSSWKDSNWGLFKWNATNPRPVFNALRSLTPVLAGGTSTQVIPVSTGASNDVVAAAFIKNNELIVSIANPTGKPRSVTIDFTINQGHKLNRLSYYINGKTWETWATSAQQQQETFEIAEESITTLIYTK